jgi:ATP-dependent DNA helicase RecG
MVGNRIYDRNEDGDYDITSSTELIAHMSRRKSDQFTEKKIFPHIREEHLKLKELIPEVKQRAVSRRPEHPWEKMTGMEIMKSAGLYDEDPITGIKGFNLAGVLLFGNIEAIQRVMPGYVTDCLLRVENIDRYDDRLRVEENLIESFDILMGFIAKHTWDRFFLIDNMNVSVRDHISKEIVSNILAHREFSGTSPARIIIEKDRIITKNWNRPLHPGRIDPDNFEPYPKNPIIARFFVNIGFADTLGSGVRNLYKYTKIYSGNEPELIEGDIFQTIIPLSRESGTSDVPINVPNVPDVPNGEITKSIIELIAKNPRITYTELAEMLSVTRKTIQRNLVKLQETEKVRRIGNNKTGHWEIISPDTSPATKEQ